jgi:hypothetical protein
MSTKTNAKDTPRAPGAARSYLEPNAFDRRVRDRNLANGAIDGKSLEKYLGELHDVADRAEPVSVHQPGLGSGFGSSSNGAG